MTQEVRVRPDVSGGFVAEVWRDGEVLYTTEVSAESDEAVAAASTWQRRFEDERYGRAESIYYILVVPETWPGPPPGAHPYSGLHFKIGRTNNIENRVQNLQTGTSGELIVHALEPGSRKIEGERHARFAAERRQGEWFACSTELCKHVFETWRRNIHPNTKASCSC